jgi:hypothetical protein
LFGVFKVPILIGLVSFAFAYKVVILVRSLSFILTHLASALILHKGFLSFRGLGDAQQHGVEFRVDKNYSI